MKIVLVIMTGIGFTLGVVFGLLLQLPIDNTHPAEPVSSQHSSFNLPFRSRRSLSEGEEGRIVLLSSKQQENDISQTLPLPDQQLPAALHRTTSSSSSSSSRSRNSNEFRGRDSQSRVNKPNSLRKQKVTETEDNLIIGSKRAEQRKANNGQIGIPREGGGVQWSVEPEANPAANPADPASHIPKPHGGWSRQAAGTGAERESSQFGSENGDTADWVHASGSTPRHSEDPSHQPSIKPGNGSRANARGARAGDAGAGGRRSGGSNTVRLTLNSQKDRHSGVKLKQAQDVGHQQQNQQQQQHQHQQRSEKSYRGVEDEDAAYLSRVVQGVTWNTELEKTCPRRFHAPDVEAWRGKADAMDVVKMEEGCGRMQNRLLTFRDSSKACARYRLNTDQIQGEIFSYYLAKLLNISNIPPTLLVQVNALWPKWRTVHLDMSLAQWADHKLVVLTEFIPNLSPALIPPEFRGEGRTLEPTLEILGDKSHSDLCELVQWSDLIVLDYLTANLDRVINNMFNKQWNDQMMSNPAHNLEKFNDGGLVFLDNESGLFHGYRLLEKYSRFHQSLLAAVCVFRPATAQAIKRLHESRSVGRELHEAFTHGEALHEHLAGIPEKNMQVLQQRVDHVYEQIVRCEQRYIR